MTETKLNHCLNFIARCTMMSSKMLLQFGKGTKFLRGQGDAVS